MNSYRYQNTLIGVLGGMGPAATGKFLLELTTACGAAQDQGHPRAIVLSDTHIADRTAAILNHDDLPLRQTREDIWKLVAWGATLIAVPCNTVHYFINQFIDEVPVPFVNIVDATLDAAQKASPEGAWLTCTRGTVETGLYQREAEKRHYTILTPDDDGLDQLMTIVGEVKAGRLSDAGIHYSEIAEQLMSMHELPLMTACTELPLAFEASGLSPSIQISSLTALAEASMSEINKLEPALS
ncbi:aspartate/glutamate racemase family protein [Propionibacterium freudenreichii]|jgi:aspartate racemase|uniref:aspartate/glutamate racemase family protein n=1 Tax=Propionibacterium freudenreichii TaxID=1744 RepID=UPI000542E4AF|nr:amino acid racemase [Propionibacterium freudenreichii]AJQ91261.1 Aspartate racemase [Propionibacterium freudenreichii subsp. freudenreichii]MCT2974450.1 aspartate/glutamate racemase family protein [Propionibacterium freudenreichii]MCT2976694.1 aspartate/glutamate racemase family protein [Propionibacterium freudenreichii]MCT2988402.1 aspartate/glutamate racemase family protein [Propionibacterium freudenreichii]MCT2995479.1 aspartate/glutamate racemase family protein [Propionibacterium freude